MVGLDKKLDLLSDHYKDTYNNCLNEARKTREWLLFLILVTLTFSLFQLFSPKDAGDVIGKILSKQFDLPSAIDISFLNSVLWFVFLSLVVRYYQTVVYIEKLYAYLHVIEDKINGLLAEDFITREGKFYLQDYPQFSKFVHFLYTWIFPLLIILIACAKISLECIQANHFSFLLGFNVAVALLIGIATILYLLKLHFKPRKNKPRDSKISILLKKWRGRKGNKP